MAVLSVTSLLVLIVVGFFLFVRWGSDWGSTAEEQGAKMSGDEFLEGGPSRRLAMTRAVTINASPEIVWPWLAQLGRGASWYSVDWLDNGHKDSARHIVSWIPTPALGDASPIGYLRHLESGQSMIWWANGVRFAGASARLVVDISLTRQGEQSRLMIRNSADASGVMAGAAILLFRFIDSIMAIRQLQGIRNRVECFGARGENPDAPETGARDQYQMYEVIYASGERAGVRGKEHAAKWRQSAFDDGVIVSSPPI
jgi:hypothetical protein